MDHVCSGHAIYWSPNVRYITNGIGQPSPGAHGLFRYARIRRNGIRSLAPDDYLMLVAAVSLLKSIALTTHADSSQGWYTMLVICLNVIASGGGSNLYLPGEYETFTQKEIKERIKGSKIVIVSEQVCRKETDLTNQHLIN